jgi:hypothetical protein
MADLKRLKGTRYEGIPRFATDENDDTVFEGIRPRTVGSPSGVIEHRIAIGDRPDSLGHHYYNDPRRWWRLFDANPDRLFGGIIQHADERGDVLLVPQARD